MKNKKIFFCLISVFVLLSVLCISCFASTRSVSPGLYKFDDVLIMPGDTDISLSVAFECDGVRYDTIDIAVGDLAPYVSTVVFVDNFDGTVTEVYNGGWLNSKYQVIDIIDVSDSYSNDILSLLGSQDIFSSSDNSIYDNIYNLIIKYLFGSYSLNEFEELTATLLSGVLSVFVFVMPVLVVVLISKELFISVGRLF